jgi:hypothetical protein
VAVASSLLKATNPTSCQVDSLIFPQHFFFHYFIFFFFFFNTEVEKMAYRFAHGGVFFLILGKATRLARLVLLNDNPAHFGLIVVTFRHLDVVDSHLLQG